MLNEHVSFEINRYRATSVLWGRPKYGGLADAMIRESCLIHFRLLLDFFYPRRHPAESIYEDVFVSDYLPDRAVLPIVLQHLLDEPDWLKPYRDQLDWRVAHLTLKRLQFKAPKRAWRPSEQFAHMNLLIEEFLGALPDDLKRAYNPNQQ